jgi:hypothetical protein
MPDHHRDEIAEMDFTLMDDAASHFRALGLSYRLRRDTQTGTPWGNGWGS